MSKVSLMVTNPQSYLPTLMFLSICGEFNPTYLLNILTYHNFY